MNSGNVILQSTDHVVLTGNLLYAWNVLTH